MEPWRITLYRGSDPFTLISEILRSKMILEPSKSKVLAETNLITRGEVGMVDGMTLVILVLVVDTDNVAGRDMLVVVEIIGDHKIQTSLDSITGTGGETQTDRCTRCRT